MVQGVCSAAPALGAVPAPGMPGLWLEPCVSHEAGVGCRKRGRHHGNVEAAGACSIGVQFHPLFRALWPRCDLFQAHGECLPVFTSLGFGGRMVNPSTPQARVGDSREPGCGQRGVTLHPGADSEPLLRPFLKSAECSTALLATSPPRAAPAPALSLL